jgi:hypothetical protein
VRRPHYYSLGVILLVGVPGLAVASFRQTLTPDVNFDAARSGGRTVQVA